ncbi:hypothetical protein KCP91_00265 [Microvirga sp. SRT01]|uniref:Uncharacterized protein n=1 Tax=Sphingomonas longa TaxID=2778730 RepID=A0ABS2D1L2_9SPHN|nr:MULTISPECIES: hypothetical protein [Alphaproteobacteria]MBM6574789.1 hypothetical protein [Sphingomonas sp. BT552]MBR7707841.1 hypothetical protein [Microvirga sp. SRT01]
MVDPITGTQVRPSTAPATAASSKTDTVAQIKAHLDGTGFLGVQTDGDIAAIKDLLTALSPADAKRVVADLQRSGTLDTVAAALTDDTMLVGSGLSASDRQGFFASMAKSLDGPGLASLSRAFGKVDQGDGATGGKPDGTDGATYARELGHAVASHATVAAKVDFVGALAKDTTATGHDSQFAATSFGGTIHIGNAQARASGEVLASLRGGAAERGFASLTGEQQKAVFTAAIGARLSAGNGQGPAGNPDYDITLFRDLSKAAATMGDPHNKAQVFAAGADVLRGERIDNQLGATLLGVRADPANKACAGMANSLATIIDSDPSRIINDLASFKTPAAGSGDISTWQGSAVAAYTKQMVLNGDAGQARLGQQVALVAAGSNGATNATAAFNAEVDGHYQTATGLGYLTGAVSASVKSIDSDAAKQRELATNIFQAGLSLVDKADVTGPAASLAKDWLGSAISSLSGTGGTGDIVARLTDAAVPTDTRGYVSAESNPLSAFRSAVTTVSTDATP